MESVSRERRCSTLGILCLLVLAAAGSTFARAQVSGETTPVEGTLIRDVRIEITNPPADREQTRVLTNQVRRVFNIYPGSRFDTLVADAGAAKVERLPQIAKASYALTPSNIGVAIALTVTLAEGVTKTLARSTGVFIDGTNFPVLYVNRDSLLQLKFQSAVWYQENINPWYGHAATLLEGNPLADNPPGAGWSGWTDNYFGAGIYGVTPISRGSPANIYGGANYLVTDSVGQDIFTNVSRIYVGQPNDEFAGIVTGNSDPRGNRLVINASYGRQHYEIGSGMLLRLSAGNGGERASLQLNPRDAAHTLALMQVRYNTVRLEGFYERPDDLPAIDTKTSLLGLNLEMGLGTPLSIGATYIAVPSSSYRYFTPTGTSLPRAGLRVADLRAGWIPPASRMSMFASAELAIETNRHFPMSAGAGYMEAGWQFPLKRWSPSFSYRYASFSGDNPSTETFERWDPLFTGGNLQQWVQGANHYKTFQNSNIIAQMVQAIANPSRKWQVVAQLWRFHAPELNNIGGPAALSLYASPDLGSEINVTGKNFISRNYYLQATVAYTTPGAAVTNAVGGAASPWFSAAAFIRFTL